MNSGGGAATCPRVSLGGAASRRITAWKWIAPRAWYSATFTKASCDCSTQRRRREPGCGCQHPAHVDGGAPPELRGERVPQDQALGLEAVQAQRRPQRGIVRAGGGPSSRPGGHAGQRLSRSRGRHGRRLPRRSRQVWTGPKLVAVKVTNSRGMAGPRFGDALAAVRGRPAPAGRRRPGRSPRRTGSATRAGCRRRSGCYRVQLHRRSPRPLGPRRRPSRPACGGYGQADRMGAIAGGGELLLPTAELRSGGPGDQVLGEQHQRRRHRHHLPCATGRGRDGPTGAGSAGLGRRPHSGRCGRPHSGPSSRPSPGAGGRSGTVASRSRPPRMRRKGAPTSRRYAPRPRCAQRSNSSVSLASSAA